MKKLLLVSCLVLLLIGLAGCGDGITQLTLRNSSSFDTNDMMWMAYDFGAVYAGASKTLEVIPGTDYVYISISGYLFQTVQAVTVREGRHAAFTLTDDTLVYTLSMAAAQSANAAPVKLKDFVAGLK